jgi:hypothetical protein
MKPTVAKPQLYAYYFLQLKEIARDHGYNLVVHGSMNRDLDLIAIPWVDDPKPEFDLINALNKHLTGHTTDEQYKEHVYLFKELPGGRHAYVINLNRGGYKKTEDESGNPIYEEDPQWYIDISVTPIGVYKTPETKLIPPAPPAPPPDRVFTNFGKIVPPPNHSNGNP